MGRNSDLIQGTVLLIAAVVLALSNRALNAHVGAVAFAVHNDTSIFRMQA